MMKYMDKIIFTCLIFAASAAVYLSLSGTLLYVG